MNSKRKPPWLNKKISFKAMHEVEKILSCHNLHSVCSQSRCPNISECFKRGAVTFLILGNTCTRKCAFCNVNKGIPDMPDPLEPERILNAVKELRLKNIVITSVTRDDLPDGGAEYFKAVINKIKDFYNKIRIEALIPDFRGSLDSLLKVISGRPDIIGHNIETVPSKYNIREGADYHTSLDVLKNIKQNSNGIYTKSSLMLGLGEDEKEIIQVFQDLRSVDCDFLSIGHYLRPSKKNYPIKDYVPPEKFVYYKSIADRMGFAHVESGVYVRSSYMAHRYTADIF